MKRIYNIFLMTLLISSLKTINANNYTIITTYNDSIITQEQKVDVRKAMMLFIQGSLIGSITGVGCHFLDAHMPKGCSWFVSMALREAWIQTLMNNIKHRNQKEIDEDQFLQYTALSTSWMSYYFCKTS